jgi:hypothetical protein
VTDDYGDPEADPQAATVDAALRDLLSDIPAEAVADPGRTSMIEVAIATAWPDGTPPTVDELAHDPDFDAVMAIAGATDADLSADDDVSAVADDFVVPDTSDADDGDVEDATDGWHDDADWDSPEGSDEQG